MSSIKALKVEKAGKHDQNLVDVIEAERSTLVVPKAARQKKKVITEKSLGTSMTKKILKTAAEQISEDKNEDIKEIDVRLPSDQEEGEEDIIEEIDLDLEENDEEARQLFEMFKGSAVKVATTINKELQKTAHSSDPNVRRIYQELGTLLKSYTSGKLPKAINVVASQNIPDWYELLEESDPMNWSANGIKAVTTLFAQSASDERLEKYYREILLEYLRNVLEHSKKLPKNVWLALVAAARRVKPFMIGLMKPLAEDPEVTQKEARVISELVGRVKIPADYINAFLIAITYDPKKDEPIAPTIPRTIFVARFVAKGKVMAIRAAWCVYAYFMQFMGIEEKQPVLWYRALHDFAKFQGALLTAEDKENLIGLLRKHKKKDVTSEIVRLLQESPDRDPDVEAPPVALIA